MQFADYILNGVTLDLFRQGFTQLQDEFEYKDAEYDYARKLFPRLIEYEKRRQSSTEVVKMKIYPVEHTHTYNLYVPVENPDGTESRNSLLSIEVTTLSNTKEQLKMTLRWEDNAENMKKVISKWARNVYDAHPWERVVELDEGKLSIEPNQSENEELRTTPVQKTRQMGKGKPRGIKLGTAERVQEMHQLLKNGIHSHRQAQKIAHTDSSTYYQYCKSVTDEDPILPYR